MVLLTSYSCVRPGVPKINTYAASSITQTTIISGGYITMDEKSTIISCGVCWSMQNNPTTDNTKTADTLRNGKFISRISGLLPDTTYFIRAYATNNIGTGYGTEIAVRTLKNIIVTDADGNEYNSVTIGEQTWMASNLKVTHYNDGTQIPLITDSTAWSKLITPGYCWYNNDAAGYKNIGPLYNWYTVNTSRLCPTGWHVPTDAEWTYLTNFLGGESIAGGKLKKVGKTYWIAPNTGATDEIGYTALPGGVRYHDGIFHDFGFSGYWWSSTDLSADRAYFRYVDYYYTNIFRFNNSKKIGFSVRCLKN